MRKEQISKEKIQNPVELARWGIMIGCFWTENVDDRIFWQEVVQVT